MFVEVFPVFVVISVQTLLKKVIITQNTFLTFKEPLLVFFVLAP